ncbi:DUF4193 domain-containing protein [Brevibacterium daeguense]|uniref:DUF4193 domain-containing protein n=1 Tax=Brevibacterium daeguense TaxID=909936 RepID=A0ABP8EG07_9MICO|nr:DUF4193 domain-containing protein [Brevibacterium daeguense]
MTSDYDAPRKQDEDPSSDSVDELKVQQRQPQAGLVDEDEAIAAEGIELPGADLSDEQLTVRVLPELDDEFTCMQCFLVRHRSQLASDEGGFLLCTDCSA